MGKAISMTLNLKMVWGNMPPSPVVWSPKGTVTFLLVCTPSKSDTTLLQRLEGVTQSLFSGLNLILKSNLPLKYSEMKQFLAVLLAYKSTVTLAALF